MHTYDYMRPAALADALAILAARPAAGRASVNRPLTNRSVARRPLTVLAGGTDFYPAHVGRPVESDILDITRVAQLRGVHDEGNLFRIGATVTWSELIATPLPPQFEGQFTALRAAAREIGGVQIQNAGTVAGNLCNASPAADGVPPLLALGARVELASQRGVRQLALTDFIVGNRNTLRRADELVTAVLIPKWRAGTRSVFLKLGHRRYLVISIAMVAVALSVDEAARITLAGVAVGACSAVAQRLSALEARLIGRPAADAAALVTADDFKHLTPIDDVRGSAAYRLDAAVTLVRQALAEAAAQHGNGAGR